jgi:hypothetical protein
MRKVIFLAALLSAIGPISTASARGPFGSIHVGNWNGGVYTNDATGAFRACTVGSSYRSGIYVMVSVSAQMGWSLGFAHPTWQLRIGEAFPIDLTFDGRERFHVYGNAIARNVVEVPMPDNSALINAFRRARMMVAFAKGRQFPFALTSTSALLPVLVNCVQQVNAYGLAAAKDLSFGVNTQIAHTRKTPTRQTEVATNAGSSLKPETNKPQSAELQIEATELASNFLMKSQLHNPKIISRSELPADLASYGAGWKSEEASGFVRIIPTPAGVKGLDVAATVIGNDARACKGKFVSGRTSELVDSDVIFQGIASCQDSDGSRIAQYFIVPRRKGGFVMFSLQANLNTIQGQEVTNNKNLPHFRKAALIAVNAIQ